MLKKIGMDNPKKSCPFQWDLLMRKMKMDEWMDRWKEYAMNPSINREI